MTRDDVMRLMAEAGAGRGDRLPQGYDGFVDVFGRFAALVAAAEREECVKVLQANAEAGDGYSTPCVILESNVAAIRARGRIFGDKSKQEPVKEKKDDRVPD